MNAREALARAYALLSECAITMKDAAIAGEAMNLIVYSISTMQNPTDGQKEDQKDVVDTK